LTNVREIALSNTAAMLEQVGREKNTAAMASETRTFLDKLWAVIEKHTPRQEDKAGDETIVEDHAFLKEKLLTIKNACEAYDKKAIKAALTELQQKEWSAATRKLLATIEEDILNGDFEAVSKAAGIVQ
jgi:leucyl-tRNA synthetase